MSELFDPVLARGGVCDALSDTEWLQAMLDFEAALARASARARLFEDAQAEAIAEACRAERFDAGEIGRAAVQTGNPAAPLVAALRDAVPDSARELVHRGATSQDVLDTATSLLARGAREVILADLDAAADGAAGLAAEHRETPMVARTLLQQAVPTTFGLKAAGWMVGLDRAAAQLAGVELAVQLGGAAGTLAALDGRGIEVLEAVAADLRLAVPVLPWHAERTRVAALGGALAGACGAIGKVALDVVLMAQTEVGEAVEEGPGRGGSSAMPHKRNPVGAVCAGACAAQAPGLEATLLAAMPHEHERAAGAWHAEWRPLRELLICTGSAAAWLRDALEHLRVDTARMRANLEGAGAERGGALGSPGSAADLVDRALRTRRRD